MTADLIARRKVFPVFFGSALKMDGVRELIAALAKYTRQPSYQKEFGARVYKIARDRQGNRLTFMKVTGGAIRSGDMVNGEKVRQVFIFNGEKSEIAKQAQAGMICGVTGLENTYAGSVLGRDTGEGFSYLEPVMTYAMTIAEGTDIQKAVKAMRQLQEEIPELHIRWDGLSREISIQLMGDIQEEVITQMIRSRWGIDVSVSAGRINYRETILQPTEGAGHFEPLRHYAEVHLRLEPGESGSGLVFETECSTDSLAVNYQKMVLSTLQNQELTGVLTGSPVTDLKITLTAGRASVKHSEGGDFREAALRAFHQGLMKAVNVLLEPYYRFVIEVPSDQSGRVMTDLDRLLMCDKEVIEV
jgi:translation elongation factor EF-G